MYKLLIVCTCVVLATAHPGYYGAQSYFFPSGQQQVQGRSDVGPIQFPSAPLSSETSGVVPGASGYGFVQPQARGYGGSFTSGQVDYW